MKTLDCLKLENQMCFPLYACSKEIIRQYRKPLEGVGLTYTQYLVMMVFWEFGGMTEKELGERVHLDSGTLAPLLKRLEKQGLVERKRVEHNERMLFISLTGKGDALKYDAISVPAAMQRCTGLSKEEMSQLRALLHKAFATMKNGTGE